MSLTGKQLKFLRAAAQTRKPVITVGAAGLSAAVMAEVELALAHHELLKIKLPAGDRALHQEMLDSICNQTGAEPVQTIGRGGDLPPRAAAGHHAAFRLTTSHSPSRLLTRNSELETACNAPKRRCRSLPGVNTPPA